MNHIPDLDDPAFYGRVRAWAAEQRDIDRAPARLVDAVMVEVEATPRRRRLRLFSTETWRPLATYGALTVVIALGVTLGVLLAGRIESVGQPFNTPVMAPSPSPSSSASPSPSASPSQSAVASPLALTRLGDVPIAATALEWDGSSVWAVDRSNKLFELDPTSGLARRSVTLPRRAIDLLVTADSVWAASPDGALVRVARTDLAVSEIDGAVGGALAEGEGVVWLGGLDSVAGISIGDNAVGPHADVPGRSPDLSVAVVGSSVWVATRSEIVELDQSSLAIIGQVTGDATRLATADGYLWATRGSELVQIDPTTAHVERTIPGMPTGAAIATSAGRVWVAGPPGSAAIAVVGVDTANGTIAFGAAAGQFEIALAVTPSVIWVASDDERIIHRFTLP
jgi:hypothetical protein